MNTDTFVIVPFFNEAEALRGVIKGLKTEFSHVVCIDDGSTDGSAEKLDNLEVVLLQFPFNLGKGAALQAAFEYSLAQPEAKYFLTYDADGQHQLKDALALVERIKKGDVDVVLGSRFLEQSDTAKVPLLKRALLRTAAAASNSTTSIRLTDAHNGLRIFNRPAAEKLELTQSGFSYASEIIDRISRYRMRYTEIPVTILYTEYSRRKGQPMLNSVNIIFDMLIHGSKRR
jgi:glycosyltransferase involved in cell wall biosynthesis